MQSYEILRQDAEIPDLEGYGVPDEARRVFCLAMGEYILGDAHGLWCEPESKDGHSDPSALAVTLGKRMSELCQLYNGKRTQSPIEDMLGAALLWVDVEWAGFPVADLLGGPEDHKELHGPSDSLLFYITPQAEIGNYKADFLLWFQLGRHIGGLVIECDGHAFHERTKEQAGRDKKRDRELLTSGFPVLRFTGSEIFKDPIGCAAQVKDALFRVLERVSKDGGLFQ